MRRKILIVLTFSLSITVALLLLHTFGVTSTGKKMELQTIAKGYYSGHKNSAYYVVNDVDEWADVWKERPLPEIDFSRTTIIAVFMGEFNTGGYGIEVKEIIDTGLSVVVKVEKTYPGRGCLVTQAFSQSYHIAKVDKIEKYVLFDTITRTVECS